MKPVRHTVWLTLLAAAAAGVVALPSRGDDTPVPRDPLTAAARVADDRFSMQSELLRRADSRAAAYAAVASLPPGGGDFSVVRRSSRVTEFDSLTRENANRMLTSLTRRDTDLRVVITTVVDTSTVIAGTTVVKAGGGLVSYDYFPPGTVAPAACVVVARIHWAGMFAPNAQLRVRRYFSGNSFNTLGPCLWYAAYGVPGAGIAAWLDSTNYAGVRGPRYSLSSINLRRTDSALTPRDVVNLSPVVSAMLACERSDGDACNALMLERPRGWARSEEAGAPRTPAWIGSWRRWGSDNSGLAATLLRRLEVEIGPTAFAKLWRSSSTLPEAFAAATGHPMEEWIRRRVSSNALPYHPGPLPRTGAMLAQLAVIGALLAIGARAVAHRGTFA